MSIETIESRPKCEDCGSLMIKKDCRPCGGQGEVFTYIEENLGDGWESCWRCKGTGEENWFSCEECEMNDE